MKKILNAASFLIVLLITINSSFAQPKFRKKFKYASIGANINAMNYVGDLDPGQSFISPGLKFTRPNIGIELLKRVGPRYSWRANFAYGRLRGDDVKNSTTTGEDVFRHARNLSFRNSVWELKADFIIDLFENRRDMRRRPQYTPYFFTGIAGFYHNPKALYNGSWVALRPLGTEGQNIDGVGANKKYSLIQAAIPVGIGFRYKLGDLWDLAFEIGWRFPFTDYLDDVSGNYVDKSRFTDPVARDLSDRSLELSSESIAAYTAATGVGVQTGPGVDGNTYTYLGGYGREGDEPTKRGDNNRDWYIVTGFHLTYIFYPKIICPKFR